MQKLRLDDMTRTEALAYLKRNDLIYVPVGPIEVHGKHLPLGCDHMVAEAFALKLAEATNGIYAPPIMYAFPGATESLKPTVGLSIEDEVHYLKAVTKGLLASGFRRILFVSIHGPGTIGLQQLMRWAFRELRQPVGYVRPYDALPHKKLEKLMGNLDGPALEATLLLGALSILGKSHLVDPRTWDDEEELPDSHASRERMMTRGGYTGLEYSQVRQHIASRSGLKVKNGVKMIEMTVEVMKGIPDDLKEYTEHLRKEGRIA